MHTGCRAPTGQGRFERALRLRRPRRDGGHACQPRVARDCRAREGAARSMASSARRSGIPPSAYDEWLEALPTGRGTVTADDVLTPAALLLAYGLEPLKPDNDTCFVAMPFRAPFLDHFDQLYRPALATIGMQSVRAWGGLSSEEYHLSLLTLIPIGRDARGARHRQSERLQRDRDRPRDAASRVPRLPRARRKRAVEHRPHPGGRVRRPDAAMAIEGAAAACGIHAMDARGIRTQVSAPAYRQFLAEQLAPRTRPTSLGTLRKEWNGS